LSATCARADASVRRAVAWSLRACSLKRSQNKKKKDIAAKKAEEAAAAVTANLLGGGQDADVIF
jgi:hypothetical protein